MNKISLQNYELLLRKMANKTLRNTFCCTVYSTVAVQQCVGLKIRCWTRLSTSKGVIIMKIVHVQNIARKLSYRKDDRAMCPEKFREYLSTLTATFAEIFNGLLFGSIIWLCVQNLNLVALPIPGVIGGTQKIGQSLDTPMLSSIQNVWCSFVQMDSVNIPAKFEVCSFTHSSEWLRFWVGVAIPQSWEG